METSLLQAIGVIETPWESIEDMPIQPLGATGVKGKIVLFDEFVPGLKDLEGFSHITLLYKFHRARGGFKMEVVPFMDNQKRGIFATRSPVRPNYLGLSTVELIGIEGNTIHIEGVDMLNGSPLLDIKPFFEKFDNRFNTRQGWLKDFSEQELKGYRSDKRFE